MRIKNTKESVFDYFNQSYVHGSYAYIQINHVVLQSFWSRQADLLTIIIFGIFFPPGYTCGDWPTKKKKAILNSLCHTIIKYWIHFFLELTDLSRTSAFEWTAKISHK